MHFFIMSKLSDREKEHELIRTSSELFFLTNIDDIKDELENLKDIKIIKGYKLQAVGGSEVEDYYVYIFMPSFNPNQTEISYGYIYEQYEVKK